MLRVGKGKPTLRVSSFKKQKPRTFEKSFEQTFASALLEEGFVSWHMSCREKGWPDRYVRGGIWIELKSLDSLGIVSGLSSHQERKLEELTKGGDRCYYLAKYRDSFIFCSWEEFKRHGKHPGDCHRFHYRTKQDLKEAIKWVLK